jgi:hypothetical protein
MLAKLVYEPYSGEEYGMLGIDILQQFLVYTRLDRLNIFSFHLCNNPPFSSGEPLQVYVFPLARHPVLAHNYSKDSVEMLFLDVSFYTILHICHTNEIH